MWAGHWMLRLREFSEEPLHLILFERHVDLDRGMTRDRRGNTRAHSLEIDGLIFARQLFKDFVEHVLDLGGVHAGWSDFYGDAAGSEGLGIETIVGEFVSNLAEDGLLRGRQFEDQWHQQTLAFDALGGALSQDFFEQHAFMCDVLVDDPQTVFIDGEDKRIADLAERLECSQGLQCRWSVRFLLNRRSASVVGDRNLWRTGKRHGGICFAKFQVRGRGWLLRRLQRETSCPGFRKIAPWSGLAAISTARARTKRRAGTGLRVDLGQKLRYGPRLHQRSARRIAHKIVDHTLLPESHFGSRRMDVNINLSGWHLQKKQDDRKNRWRQDVAVSVGQRMLNKTIADQPSVDKNKNRITVELLDFRLGNKSMQTNFAGFRSLRFFFRIAAPGRWLRQADALQRLDRSQWNQLIESLLSENLVHALAMACNRRR